MRLRSRRKAPKLNHSGAYLDEETANLGGMGTAQGYYSSLVGKSGALVRVVWDVVMFRVVGSGSWGFRLLG